MENPYATYRNGHQLFNTFNPEDNTLDIRSNALWPANVLSNLWEKPFVFEDVECGSMEGFLQSLKYPESEKQKTVCILYGNRSKNAGKLKDEKKAWFHKQLLYWKDIAIPRQYDVGVDNNSFTPVAFHQMEISSGNRKEVDRYYTGMN